jgi:hypothetical protein
MRPFYGYGGFLEDRTMHKTIAALLLALSPAVALAQPAPATNSGAPGDRTITRAQFVQQAADIAGRRFDEIDTAHSGVLTRSQIRAWREAHRAPVDSQ